MHEEQRMKSDVSASYRLGSHGIKTEKIDEIQLAEALNANLKKLHFILWITESHVGRWSNYLICIHLSLQKQR